MLKFKLEFESTTHCDLYCGRNFMRQHCNSIIFLIFEHFACNFGCKKIVTRIVEKKIFIVGTLYLETVQYVILDKGKAKESKEEDNSSGNKRIKCIHKQICSWQE
jgi:hypothetical protein